jgi:cathepsin D
MGAPAFVPDGILGLAFPSSSKFIGKSPLFHTLYNEGKLSQPMFSLKLTSSGGELYVGGTNEALYIHSTLVFAPVTNPVSANARLHGCILRFPFQVLWQLKIDNIRVNGKIVLTNVAAVIDTGSHFIIGDLHRVLALHAAAGGGAYMGNLRGPGYYTCELRSILVPLIDSL